MLWETTRSSWLQFWVSQCKINSCIREVKQGPLGLWVDKVLTRVSFIVQPQQPQRLRHVWALHSVELQALSIRNRGQASQSLPHLLQCLYDVCSIKGSLQMKRNINKSLLHFAQASQVLAGHVSGSQGWDWGYNQEAQGWHGKHCSLGLGWHFLGPWAMQFMGADFVKSHVIAYHSMLTHGDWAGNNLDLKNFFVKK